MIFKRCKTEATEKFPTAIIKSPIARGTLRCSEHFHVGLSDYVMLLSNTPLGNRGFTQYYISSIVVIYNDLWKMLVKNTPEKVDYTEKFL